jgi:hypothetical protein
MTYAQPGQEGSVGHLEKPRPPAIGKIALS